VPVDPGAYLDGGRWDYGVSGAASDEAATIQLLVDGGLADERLASVATAHLVAEAQIGGFPGFRLGASQPIEIAGATDAERTDFTYDGGLGDPIRGVWLVAAHRDLRRSVAVQITSLRPDEDLIRQVQESVRLSTDDGAG
jgi:hypothetical protein